MLNKIIAVAAVAVIGKIGYDVFQSGKKAKESGDPTPLIIFGKRRGTITIKSAEAKAAEKKVEPLLKEVSGFHKASR